MNHPHQNYNHIRIYHKAKHPEDQQMQQFEERYVFKTHPSFQFSEDRSKKIPKSQKCVQKTNHNDDYYRKQTTTKRNLLKHQFDQDLMQPKQKYSPRQFQTQKKLRQKVLKLTKSNGSFQQENVKLKNYVQFLQDYNLKLKKQLMRFIRRRNIDSSLGSIYDEQAYKKCESPRKQEFSSQNKLKYDEQNKYFTTIQPLQKLVSKPIFTNHRLANEGPHRSISFGNVKNQQINQQKYVSAFHETMQKPFYHNFLTRKVQQNYNRLKKIYPTSLQSSFFNNSNQINPQSYSNRKFDQKMYSCLNNSLPVIQNIATPVSQNQYQYKSLEHSNNKAQEKKTQKKFVCTTCLKSVQINGKSSKFTKKNPKNKNQNTKNIQRSINSTRQRCSSCNEIKSSKRSNASKSTIPTKQKQSYNFLHSNELSQKLNSGQQKRNKHQRIKQKIEISEFNLK